MLSWFVVNTKPKKEAIVERLFLQVGIVVYNPKYREEVRSKP